ncbi:hypothetical protein Tco_0299847 [Tanacetum coccineum]
MMSLISFPDQQPPIYSHTERRGTHTLESISCPHCTLPDSWTGLLEAGDMLTLGHMACWLCKMRFVVVYVEQCKYLRVYIWHGTLIFIQIEYWVREEYQMRLFGVWEVYDGRDVGGACVARADGAKSMQEVFEIRHTCAWSLALCAMSQLRGAREGMEWRNIGWDGFLGTLGGVYYTDVEYVVEHNTQGVSGGRELLEATFSSYGRI